MFWSEHIQNEVLTINSEQPSSEDRIERKFQAKFSPYEQSFEKPRRIINVVQGRTP